jgi:hypothetical protein
MPAQIAAILAHELVHAAVGIPAGHGKAFKRVALGLGLVGPMRATTPARRSLRPSRRSWMPLAPSPMPVSTRTGSRPRPRSRKPGCSNASARRAATVRTARKWLELAGAPLCPIEDHGVMQHEPLDDDEADEG